MATISQATATPVATSAISPPAQSTGGATSISDILCWEKAVKLFNDSLTKDDKKRVGTTKNNKHQVVSSIDDLLKETEAAKEKCLADRGRFRKKLEQILKTFDQYAIVIDVMIQHQPHITALVWGSIRGLLGVATREIAVSERLADAILDILEQIGRWEEYLQLFATSARVQDAIARLFSQIINFLVRATLHYDRPWAVRYARTSLSPANPKIFVILSRIQTQSDTVEREVLAAAEARHAEGRESMKSEYQKQEDYRADSRVYQQDSRSLQQQIADIQRQYIDINIDTNNMMTDFLDAEDRRVEAQILREQIDHVIRWLQPTPPLTTHTSPWEEGTCEWITTHPSYSAWVQSGFSKPLWIYGIPGCGKSVMARFLSQNATTKYAFTHFFRNSADKNSSMATPFVIALLAQLFESDSLQPESHFASVVGFILPLFDHFKSAAECPFHKLWPLVKMMFEAIPGDFTLTLDALDECNDPDHSGMLLERLTQLSSLTHARVILLSRYHTALNESLGEAFRVVMDPISVTPDISLFVDREIGRTLSLQSLRQSILTKAVENSGGMFLWAKMMLVYLKGARTQNVQLRRLQGFPTGLAEVYDHLLSEVAHSLDQEELSLRRTVFLLLVGASRPFSLKELSVLIALRCPSGFLDEKDLLLDPEGEILRVCWPLAMVVNDSIQLIHMSVKEFLIRTPEETGGVGTLVSGLKSPCLTLRDSHTLLARKCLSKLSQNQYKVPGHIAQLIRRNTKVMDENAEGTQPNYEAICYNYACYNWQVHLRAISAPTGQLLQQAERFLVGYEFVTWSEVLFRLDNDDFSAAIDVRTDLESWFSLLPPDAKRMIPINQYFDLPYRSLTSFFEESGGDRLLPLLCQARLGDYWSLNGSPDMETGTNLLKKVAEGFRELLGARNPLSLQAERNFLIEYSWMNRWCEARDGLSRVARIQQEVVGEDLPDYYLSLEYAAWANYSLTNFHDSTQDQARATAGLFRTAGPTDKECLRSQMFQGWTLERQGLLEQAFYLYEDVWKIWTTLTGPENPMSQMVQKSIASVHWKRGEIEKAEKLMLENFVARQRTFTIKAVVAIDSGFQLAVMYREMDRREESQALLDLMSEDNALQNEFERFCQFEHLRALLELDNGACSAAHVRLKSLLYQATARGRDANNRELLWVRLTLADMLRKQDKSDEAATLFDDIVRPAIEDTESNQSLTEEPDTPYQLAIAEEALRHVRLASFTEADKLLGENGLEWVRKQDFWILFGGPITDTAAMKGAYEAHR